MAASISLNPVGPAQLATRAEVATSESRQVRWALISVALLFLVFFLLMPLAIVFTSALAKGVSTYFAAFREPDAISAIELTLLAAGIAVPLNLIFGIT